MSDTREQAAQWCEVEALLQQGAALALHSTGFPQEAARAELCERLCRALALEYRGGGECPFCDCVPGTTVDCPHCVGGWAPAGLAAWERVKG